MVRASHHIAFHYAAPLGLMALLCATVIAEEAQPKGGKSRDYWRAWAVTEGKETRLVVEGIYGNGGPGLVVLVKEAVPQGTNPKILLLELKAAKLPGIWPAVVHPVPGYFANSPYKKGQYDAVHIRYPDGSLISIDKIIDAGSGPK